MERRHFLVFARIFLVVVAIFLGIGQSRAESAAVAAQPQPATKTAVKTPSSQCKAGQMRCVTNAQRRAAAQRAASRRTATATTSLKTATVDAGVAAATTATTTSAIPLLPGCPTPVMNPGGMPDYMSGCVGNSANSPLPTDLIGTGGIRKFVDALPSIPVAKPDQFTYPGSDYYEISLVEYTQKMHSDLPATLLRGYVQTNHGKDPAGLDTGAPAPVQYLGPLIIAQKNRPVRVKFTNNLPTGANGNLFIPVDTTVMGSGMAPDGSLFAQNRSGIHLHGGNTPWISDGTPHQWTTPAGESTSYPKGVSVRDVPDMPPSGPGEMTFFYTNQQSARLMFYHDHAYGITRLNVYAGVAAGYLLQDPIEQTLVAGGTITANGTPVTIAPETIPSAQIPLVIQDKTFIPSPEQLAAQDPTWNWGPKDVNGNFLVGNLWFPHVYMPNQNPSDESGANAMGRWDWGPWFWPPMDPSSLKVGEVACPNATNPNQTCPGTPNPSLTPEGFMDTPIVNGMAYPYVTVDPKPYRLRILNAANDRTFSLQLYCADSTVTSPDGRSNTEVKMVPAVATPGFPALWPTDGRDGGVPDPAQAGPPLIQIGTEAGFLPNPAVIPSTPVNYVYNRRDIIVLSVSTHGLLLGPAERADVVVDFSQAPAGCSNVILYNDAPAPMPAFDTRFDYYTGDPDQTETGGAPSTLPGFGPNTRTLMQFRLTASGSGSAATNLLDTCASHAACAKLQAALPAAFSASEDKPIIPEAVFGPVYNTTYKNSYSRIADTSLFTGSITDIRVAKPGSGYTSAPSVAITGGGGTGAAATATVAGGVVTGFTVTNPGTGYNSTPLVTLTGGGGTGAKGEPVGVPITRKAIQELFELDYGRMNATLGVELPFTDFFTQTTIPLGYVDPPTEIFKDGEVQIWKITHNGVDTHAIHFHLFNVQLINRVGWDGAIRPPEANELGWKETVRMSPLEDAIVALRPLKQNLPWPIPDSIHPLDVTKATNSTITVVNPVDGTPLTIPNADVNFGQEYVWHCHLLGHEENDMMRAMVFQVAPEAPSNLSATRLPPATNVSILLKDNSVSETGFTVQRSIDPSFATGVTTLPAVPPAAGYGSIVSFNDTTAAADTVFYYRAQAFSPNGTSAWSNIAQLVSGQVTATPASLTFASTTVGAFSSSKIVTVNNGTGSAVTIGAATTTANFGVSTNNCPASLAAGASCQVYVQFRPTSVGALTGTLNIATSSIALVVNLSGTGTGTLTVNPTTMSFGSLQVGNSSSSQVATVMNTTGAAVTISSVSITGQFAVSNNGCSGSLANGTSCKVYVQFRPTSVGAKTGTLSIATPSSTLTVSLSGTATGTMTANPTALSFGSLQIRTASSSQLVTVRNNTGAAVTISSVSASGQFAVSNNGCPASLANGSSCSVYVQFRPTTVGAQTGTLTIANSSAPLTVSLAGTGTGSFTASPASLTFPSTAVGSASSSQVVSVTNNSGAAVTISSIATTANFVVSLNNCPASLADATSCSVYVRFQPTLSGTLNGTLTINNSFATRTVSLTGVAP